MRRSRSCDSIALVAFLLELICCSEICQAQTNEFSRQEACPQNDAVMGYTTLDAINADMADELARIEGGGDPEAEYNLFLCPAPGVLLDPRRGSELRPVLDNVNIACADGAECVFDRSQVQVLIENSQVSSYPLNSVRLTGLIFQRFIGTAISFRANRPTEVTCENCVFRDFTTTLLVVEIFSPTPTGDPAGTLRIINGVIESTDAVQSTTTSAFFDNSGGFLVVNGLVLRNSNPKGPIFSNRNADTRVSDLIIQNNVLDGNIANNQQGPMTFDVVSITNNQVNEAGFLSESANAPVTLNNVTFSNNLGNNPWTGVLMRGGASATVFGMDFSSNNNVKAAISSEGPEATTIEVTDSRFASNSGASDSSDFSNSMLTAAGNGEGSPNLRMERLEFEGNENIAAEIAALNGGNFDVSGSCFLGGSMQNLAFSDGSGSAVADASSNSAAIEFYTLGGSECTTEEEGLLNVNQGSAASCLALATADFCASQLVVSEPPSQLPSLFPTVEIQISASPMEQLDSFFPSDHPSVLPSVSLEPSFLPTKPPTYRPDCPDGDDDDDDDDDDDGKGKGAKRGRQGGQIKRCRNKKLKRKKREKLFGTLKLNKLEKATKEDAFKSYKSGKSSEGNGWYDDGDDDDDDDDARADQNDVELRGPPKFAVSFP